MNRLHTVDNTNQKCLHTTVILVPTKINKICLPSHMPKHFGIVASLFVRLFRCSWGGNLAENWQPPVKTEYPCDFFCLFHHVISQSRCTHVVWNFLSRKKIPPTVCISIWICLRHIICSIQIMYSYLLISLLYWRWTYCCLLLFNLSASKFVML